MVFLGEDQVGNGALQEPLERAPRGGVSRVDLHAKLLGAADPNVPVVALVDEIAMESSFVGRGVGDGADGDVCRLRARIGGLAEASERLRSSPRPMAVVGDGVRCPRRRRSAARRGSTSVVGSRSVVGPVANPISASNHIHHLPHIRPTWLHNIAPSRGPHHPTTIPTSSSLIPIGSQGTSLARHFPTARVHDEVGLRRRCAWLMMWRGKAVPSRRTSASHTIAIIRGVQLHMLSAQADRNVTFNVVTSAWGDYAMSLQQVTRPRVITYVQRAVSNLSVSVIIPDPTAPISISIPLHPSGIHPLTPASTVLQFNIGTVRM